MPRTRGNISEPTPWSWQEFLEQLPFTVAILDREYRIVMANLLFIEQFGDWHGKRCFEVYKKLAYPCPRCTAMQTLEDGVPRVTDEVGVDQRGRRAHYVVHSAPLRIESDGPVTHILEMSTDVTGTQRWQQEYEILFDRVPCYITVIDDQYRIIRANEAFRERFGDVRGERCYEVYKKRKRKCAHCPAAKTFKDGLVHRSNQTGISVTGDHTDYVVTTSPLPRGREAIAHVIEISTDVTEIRQLEAKMIEAERLAAVGQTVAGLAHSIKNILMGLEGGKYIVSMGLERNDRDTIVRGWEMLGRNIDKTTSLVKNFLSFAKGRLPKVKMVDPNRLVNEIVELYREVARAAGIDLRAELDPKMKTAPLDADGIHTCLTNLVSNALDACEMSERKDRSVIVRTREAKGELVFEVVDNGAGMDCEIKQKIFTTFFTTKGGEGTGLGLLTTRKIVQEHGGKITVFSKKDEGSRFRIILPRKRLSDLFARGTDREVASTFVGEGNSHA